MTEAETNPPPQPEVEVGHSSHGLGLFARRPFGAGELVVRFRGTAVDFAGTLAKGDRECDTLQIGPNLYLDLEPPGRFVNHSCDPNACVRFGTMLVALRPIGVGEEVRFDYSTTMDEDHYTLHCLCGSPRCRGTIRDFRWLPQAWKLELIARNAVPAFIVAAELDAGRLTPAEVRFGQSSSPGIIAAAG